MISIPLLAFLVRSLSAVGSAVVKSARSAPTSP
jgi:hypothetical protein